MLYKLAAALLLAALTLHATAQQEEEDYSWWEYGLNIGAYIPDNYAANFYNGSGENDITRILNNEYRREEIERELGDYQYSLGALPQNMQYNVATMPGIHVAYHRDTTTSFFVNMQFVKLQTSDVFRLELEIYDETFDDYVLGDIYGTEERVYIDLGLRKVLAPGEQSAFYMMGGININNTTVQENKITIERLTYSIKTNYSSTEYVPGVPVNEYNIKQGGIGIGGFFGAGGQFYFENNIYVALDISTYYTQTILPGREHFALQVLPLLRIGYQSASLF
jgi:hypothetical protein